MSETSEHTYVVKVSQNVGGTGGTEGRVYTLENPLNENFISITTQTPAEFKGPNKDGKSLYWTPEDLFVSALAVCLQATFVTIAENSHLKYSGFEVTATGTLGKNENNQSWFPKIVENVVVYVPEEKYARKAEKIVRLAENNCLIANSIKTQVEINIEVKVISGE